MIGKLKTKLAPSMLTDQSVDPLSRFPLLHTSDADAFGHAIVERYGATRAYTYDSNAFQGRVNFLRLSSLKLGFIAINSPGVAEYSTIGDFRQRFLISGNTATKIGSRDFDSRTNASIVVMPGQSTVYRFSEKF